MTVDDDAPARQTARAHAPPTGRAAVKILVIVATMIALTPFTLDMYLPAFPQMEADLDATNSQIQLSLTGVLVGLAVGQLLVGPLADAFGRRRPVLLGLLCHVGASGLCFVASDAGILAACRVLQGVSCAAVSVVSMATVRDLFAGSAHARIMSRMFLVIGIGPVIAPTLGAGVLLFADWRSIFLVLALIGVTLLVVGLIFFPDTLPPEQRTRRGLGSALTSYAALLRDPTYTVVVLVGALMFSTIFSYISGASFVFQDRFGLSEQQFATLFAVNAGGLVLVAQINPLLIRRFGVAQVLTGATVAGTVGATALLLALTVFEAPLACVAVLLAFCVASYGVSTPNTQGLALVRQGHRAGAAAALLGFSQFAVGAIVTPLVGLGVADGVAMAAVMTVTTTSAALLMLLVVRRQAANMQMT
ncbi:multidrug effflux MFS transporter [Nocardia rhamnosiphila]|uniref:Multidrug effflux MFS transporter n=1 Tax=Nocardia rhamnosiphila TaxID=426716 RepID=A0ABV2WYR7_9NOCA